eukprot:3440890-Pyramimonas_sp.AAC.1
MEEQHVVAEYKRELSELARDAKRQMVTWGLVKEPPKPTTSGYAKIKYLMFNDAVKAHMVFGGQEAVGTYLRLASVDVDGDGNISAEELTTFNESGSVIIGTIQSFLLNIGIVAAL